ncbi:uncharacterized protein LOC134246873, partial [Saccostrea cucullata]|uniref:uncharacterized protein LOC134246873 n=1 Tax=Saccostrea cuccullata TaxID=36930 RepID=UPI002ED17DC5
MSDIKGEINSMETAIDANDMSKLFCVTSSVHLYRNLPPKIMLSLPKFSPEKIQGEDLNNLFGTISSNSLTLDQHGYSMKTTQKSPEAGSSPPVKQLLDEPETVTTIHTGYGYLYNVACLSDEEIWTSGNDSTMKHLSINRGSLLKSITTNTSSGDLLVIMNSDDYTQTKVVRYSGSTEKQTIQFDYKGKPLYSSGGNNTNYITENRNLDICVNEPFTPQGITTDSQSHILTADINNYCVHIIDQDGQFLCYIDCRLSSPMGLCTDTDDNL